MAEARPELGSVWAVGLLIEGGAFGLRWFHSPGPGAANSKNRPTLGFCGESLVLVFHFYIYWDSTLKKRIHQEKHKLENR